MKVRVRKVAETVVVVATAEAARAVAEKAEVVLAGSAVEV